MFHFHLTRVLIIFQTNFSPFTHVSTFLVFLVFFRVFSIQEDFDSPCTLELDVKLIGGTDNFDVKIKGEPNSQVKTDTQ